MSKNWLLSNINILAIYRDTSQMNPTILKSATKWKKTFILCLLLEKNLKVSLITSFSTTFSFRENRSTFHKKLVNSSHKQIRFDKNNDCIKFANFYVRIGVTRHFDSLDKCKFQRKRSVIRRIATNFQYVIIISVMFLCILQTRFSHRHV